MRREARISKNPTSSRTTKTVGILNIVYNMSGISALRREPARIQNEIMKLDENLNSVCLDHYNAFIINHETFRYCERNVRRFFKFFERERERVEIYRLKF